MGMLDRQYDEKRDFIRMQINTPAQIDIGEGSIDAICHDLSGGGMLLSVDKELANGQEVQVTIMSSYGHSPMLQAHCQVTRSESGPNSSYVLGLEILEVIDQPESTIA